MPTSTYALNVPSVLRDRLRAQARQAGSTISAAAVNVLRLALPRMQEAWQDYVWPAPRNVSVARIGRATVTFDLPDDLRSAYAELAEKLLFRAVNEGRYWPKADPLLGPPTAVLPTPWLLSATLQDYTSDADGTLPAPTPKSVDLGISDGPLVQVTLPARAVEWMLRSNYNRSAFIRGAIEAQLPALSAAKTIPAMSRLMPDAPSKNTPVRMSTTMHERLKATASAKGVSMTHLMRAACLTHMAAQAAKATAPAAPASTPQTEVPA